MRNSIVLLDRNGEIAGTYDKNHPTIGELEQGKLPGTEVPIVECDFGRVALVICFDLNFDRLREQVKAAKPDLILFCSNYHGGLMQAYWAYSCRSHFVGSIRRMAPSEIRNPLGNVVATNTDYFDYAVAEVHLDCESAHFDFNGKRFKAMKKKYGHSGHDHGPRASWLRPSDRVPTRPWGCKRCLTNLKSSDSTTIWSEPLLNGTSTPLRVNRNERLMQRMKKCQSYARSCLLAALVVFASINPFGFLLADENSLPGQSLPIVLPTIYAVQGVLDHYSLRQPGSQPRPLGISVQNRVRNWARR